MRHHRSIVLLGLTACLLACGGSGDSVRVGLPESDPVRIAPAYTHRILAVAPEPGGAAGAAVPSSVEAILQRARFLELNRLVVLPPAGARLPDPGTLRAYLDAAEGTGVAIGIGCRIDPEELAGNPFGPLLEQIEADDRVAFVEIQGPTDTTRNRTASPLREPYLDLSARFADTGRELFWFLPAETAPEQRAAVFALAEETPEAGVIAETFGPGGNTELPLLGYLDVGERARLERTPSSGLGLRLESRAGTAPAGEWVTIRDALVVGREMGLGTARLELREGSGLSGLAALGLDVFGAGTRHPFVDARALVIGLLGARADLSREEALQLGEWLDRYRDLHRRTVHTGPLLIPEAGGIPSFDAICALGMALENGRILPEADSPAAIRMREWLRQAGTGPDNFDAAVWDKEEAVAGLDLLAAEIDSATRGGKAAPVVDELRAAVERDRRLGPALVRCLYLGRAAHRYFEMNPTRLNREQLTIEVERAKNLADAALLSEDAEMRDVGRRLDDLVGRVFVELSRDRTVAN